MFSERFGDSYNNTHQDIDCLAEWIFIAALIFMFLIDISPYRAVINGSNCVQLSKSYISFAYFLHQAEIVMKSTLTLIRVFFSQEQVQTNHKAWTHYC